MAAFSEIITTIAGPIVANPSMKPLIVATA